MNMDNLDFGKCGGLIPAIIQNAETRNVLMLGYMSPESLKKTEETGLVTFYSRSRNCLWTKGETSGNYLKVVSMYADCDRDTILIKAIPSGPVCHTGAETCFDLPDKASGVEFLAYLQDFITRRYNEMPEGSYTTSLFNKGINRMAQKVGEEAVETVIEATNGTDDRLVYEGADLLYHLIVLLTSKGLSIQDLVAELITRHKE